jgi:hypothetical protein
MKRNVIVIILLVIATVIISGCGAEKSGVSVERGYYTNTAFPDKPTAPKNLKAEADQSRIVLSWEMPAWEDRYPFDIYRWSAGLEPKILDTVPAGVHNYTDSSASKGFYYYYLVVTRKNGSGTSASTAQIAGIVLEPSSSAKPPIWARNGVTPPLYDFGGDITSQVAWSERKAQEIREKLPWIFIDETCPQCGGRGIITLNQSNANGLPDLTWCPNCKGTGTVTNIYPKS